ncbi:substrate-binding domain-containing protein [Salinibius halmophilus]|uniref:substrate-binding domain-containing protein n=1 Tax=Salinibius halmophilus TaxID=1853216 RepID=UPI000E670426|nr:substrate-binding domain-containing protein [Salinibius halmophilus]
MRATILRFITIISLLYSTSAIAAISPIEQTLATSRDGTILKLAGSNTLGADLLPNMMVEYMKAKGIENLRIQPSGIENEVFVTGTTRNGSVVRAHIAAHGSSTGFVGLANNEIDIAAASRPIKSTEAAKFPEFDMTGSRSEHVVGIDGLAIVVHPSLPMDYIDVDVLGKLFSGEINNWRDLQDNFPEYQLPNLPVSIHARDGNSGTYDSFESMVLDRGYELSEQAQRYESNEVLSQQVASLPGSIGFTAVATVGQAKALAVKDIGTIAMSPERILIAAEDYPLSRRLYLYTTERNNPHVSEFLEFAASQAGQDVVERVGFVSQNIIKLPQPVFSDMPDGYRRLVGRAERLSVNFRFVGEERQLDNKALVDLRRVAEFMQKPENQDRELMLFGFSDAIGDESRAILISEVRTLAVRKALREYGIRAKAITGYGSLNPVAQGPASDRNNRVEVWIKE